MLKYFFCSIPVHVSNFSSSSYCLYISSTLSLKIISSFFSHYDFHFQALITPVLMLFKDSSLKADQSRSTIERTVDKDTRNTVPSTAIVYIVHIQLYVFKYNFPHNLEHQSLTISCVKGRVFNGTSSKESLQEGNIIFWLQKCQYIL